MCRVLVRRFTNHRFATATRAERRTLWQAGDCPGIVEDGQSFGKKADVSPNFYIFELPKIPAIRMVTLIQQPENARRTNQLDLALLRTKLTPQETVEMNSGRATLANGERKLNQSTITRPI